MNVPPAFCVARNQIIEETRRRKKVVIEINDISRTFEQKKEKYYKKMIAALDL